ncbi:MAG: ABC transporter substrate-binding protein [Candidatus Limivicinus sp.]
MKRFPVLMLAVLTLTAFAGCGASAVLPAEGTPAAEISAEVPAEAYVEAPAERLNLDIIVSRYSDKTQDWWEQFEADFEAANEGIGLSIEVVPWSDIYSLVNSRISESCQPDILNISGFADYVADNLLMPAEEYVSPQLKKDIIPSFWESNAVDGTVWALPLLASCRTLFCNMDILDRAGVEVPGTWDDVIPACRAIKEKCPGVTPWALDISTDEGQAAFSYYAWNFGGGFVDSDGCWALNSEENIKALEYISDLYNSGCCNASPMTDTRSLLQEQFNEGSLAMMIGPFNMAVGDRDFNLTVSALPAVNSEPATPGICDQLVVFKNDEAPDQTARTAAVTAFLDAFYQPDTYAGYMVYEGFLPVTGDASRLLTSEAERFKDSGGVPGNSELFAHFCPLLPSCRFYPLQKAEWMDVRNGVIEAEQNVCRGDIPAREALDRLQRSVT